MPPLRGSPEPPKPPQDSLHSLPAQVGGEGQSKDPIILYGKGGEETVARKQAVLRSSSAATPAGSKRGVGGAASAPIRMTAMIAPIARMLLLPLPTPATPHPAKLHHLIRARPVDRRQRYIEHAQVDR
jgi:hypothetical protein